MPTFNRFKVLEDISTTQASNKSDMGFHSDVHSKVTHCQRPVNTCVNSSDEDNCQLGSKSLKVTDNDRKQVNSQTKTGKRVKQWVLSENADKCDLELRFKPCHRQKIENARNNATFDKWNKQMNGKYGFIPLGDLVKPNVDCKNPTITDVKLLHNIVKNAKNHNFLGAQVQVKGQLNPDKWQMRLFDYWDDQLCSLIRYGFPLDFNVNSPLSHEINNHSSAVQYTKDVKAYINEEKEFKAIHVPYLEPPLDNMHFSPLFNSGETWSRTQTSYC